MTDFIVTPDTLDAPLNFIAPSIDLNTSLTAPLLKAVGPTEEDYAACEFLYKIHPEIYKEERHTFELTPDEARRYRLFLRAIDDCLCEFRTLVGSFLTFLDPTEAPYVILPLLAPIVGIDFNYDVPEDIARREVINAIFLWERKGTRDNFRDWIQFLTGYRVQLREFYKEVFRSNVWGQSYHEQEPAEINDVIWREEWNAFLPTPSYSLSRVLPPTVWEEEWERYVPGDPYATLPHLDEHHRTNQWDGNSLARPFYNFHFEPDINYGVHGSTQTGVSTADQGALLPGFLYRNHQGVYIDFPDSDIVDQVDDVHTSKPVSTLFTINGTPIETGLRVIFLNLTGAQAVDNGSIWIATVSGISVTWSLYNYTTTNLGIDFTWHGTPFLEIIIQKIGRILDLITLYGVVNHLFWRIVSTENAYLCHQYSYQVIPRFIEGWGAELGEDVELPPDIGNVNETLNCDAVDEDFGECFGDTYSIDIGNLLCCQTDDDPPEPCGILGRLATVTICTNDEERTTNTVLPSPWLTYYPAKYWSHQIDDTLEWWTPTTSGALSFTDIISAEYALAEIFIDPFIGTGVGQGIELPTEISPYIINTCLSGEFEDLVIFEEWNNPFAENIIFNDNWNFTQSFISTLEFSDDWNLPAFVESLEYSDDWNITNLFPESLEFTDNWDYTVTFEETFEEYDDWEDNLPMLIPDDEIWLDGNDGPMANSPVISWLDRSPASFNDASQPTFSQRPDYLKPTVSYNNFGTVVFDGIDDNMVIADHSSLNTDQFSLYFVGEWNNPTNFASFVSKLIDNTMTTGGWGLVQNGNSGNNLRFFVDNINTHYLETTLANNVPVIIKCSYNQVSLKMSVNGVPVVTGSPLYGGGTTNSSTELHIGARKGATSTPEGFLSGTVAEFIYYSRVLSSPEDLALHLYLSAKYGISITTEFPQFTEDWEFNPTYTQTQELFEPFEFNPTYTQTNQVTEPFDVMLTYSETTLITEFWDLAGVENLVAYESWNVAPTYTGTGGMTTGGTASVTKTKGYTATGGLTSGGTAALVKVKDYTATGGMITGGAAFTTQAGVFTYTGTGNLVSGGTADVTKSKDFTATGGATFGGAATVLQAQEYVGTGGMTTGGTAALVITKVYTATGGLTTGGTADVTKTKNFTGTGGLVTGGAAATEYDSGTTVFTYTGTGGMTTGGTADVTKTKAFTATGGLTTGGTADVTKTKAYTATGGLTTGGAAFTSTGDLINENWDFDPTYMNTNQVTEPFEPTVTTYTNTNQVTEPFNTTIGTYTDTNQVTEPWNVTLSYSDTTLVNDEEWNT